MGIVSAKVDELAQRLARLTGEDVETALARSIEERLSRVEATTGTSREAALQKFFDRVSTMPVKDACPADDVIGYGPDGLPS